MRVIGIDASLRSTGAGVVETQGSGFRALEFATIRNPPSKPHSVCLCRIQQELSAMLARCQPDAAAIEGGFYFKNAKTALVLGEVRGVAIAGCAAAGVPVFEYSPRRAKQNVTGWGAAPKEQVAKMVRSVLGLAELPPPDATDALALALCHAQTHRGLNPGEPI